jgi:hypothetical protein
MDKVIKNIARPERLQDILLSMKPGKSVQIYCTAYKPDTVRVRCGQLNKKYKVKMFSSTTKGLVDSTIVTRLQ